MLSDNLNFLVARDQSSRGPDRDHKKENFIRRRKDRTTVGPRSGCARTQLTLFRFRSCLEFLQATSVDI